MNRPGSISVQACTGPSVASGGVKCGPSGPARISCIGVSDIGFDRLEWTQVPATPQVRSRGITSTISPFEVGIPVPSVSPPISRQEGGPYGTRIIPAGIFPFSQVN